MLIRHATMADLKAVTAVEAACFPAAEAATADELRDRIAAYPECFWLLVDDNDDTLVSFVNGFVTDRSELTDDMYADVSGHDPHGAWQMIFGVDTAPEYRHHGHASDLLRQVIADTRAAGRKGLVLTAKPHMTSFYTRLGFIDEGPSVSTHGQTIWHQMRLTF